MHIPSSGARYLGILVLVFLIPALMGKRQSTRFPLLLLPFLLLLT
jgi:hypothetical protein